MTGTVITKKGVALIAKLLATEQQLTFTRAAVGTGNCPSGYDPASMLDLGQYRMDGMIADCKAEEEEATVTFQISSKDVEEGFIITEAGLYASDADEGEILYAYLDLTDDPQYVYAKGGVVQKFAEIDFKTVVGSVKNITANISPTALVTKKEYDILEKRTADLEVPDLDIPEDGMVEGINSFPDCLASMVSKIPLVRILRNMYAGAKFVLHVGQIVNNCTSEAEDLPLAAAQGKVLMDMVTKLNSDMKKSIKVCGTIGHDSIANPKFFNDLSPGMYELHSARLDYFPFQWGVLINIRGASNYGTMLFLHAYGSICSRSYSIVNNDWYTDWIEIHKNTSG